MVKVFKCSKVVAVLAAVAFTMIACGGGKKEKELEGLLEAAGGLDAAFAAMAAAGDDANIVDFPRGDAEYDGPDAFLDAYEKYWDMYNEYAKKADAGDAEARQQALHMARAMGPWQGKIAGITMRGENSGYSAEQLERLGQITNKYNSDDDE